MYLWRTLCQLQFFVLLIIYAYLGLIPHPEESIPVFNDKLMHMSGYFVAAFSISFAYPKRGFIVRGIFLILFSIGIEIGQHFMPPRTFDVYDICANSAGVTIGLLSVFFLQTRLEFFKRFLFLSVK